MRKLFAIVLILCLFPVIALADVDLSAMSFDELKALQIALNNEIVSRPEWKEVTVPGGTWIVGKDIPAGSYSLHPTSEGGYVRVYNNDGRMIIYQGIRDEENSIGKLDLLDGYAVEISRGSLIFAPAITLGF